MRDCPKCKQSGSVILYEEAKSCLSGSMKAGIGSSLADGGTYVFRQIGLWTALSCAVIAGAGISGGEI